MTDEGLLEQLLDQERRLQFEHFDNDDAFTIGMALVERGRREKLGITVDASRTRHQLFHVSLLGTTADNDEWVRRKNNVVYRFGHSSFYIGNMLRLSGQSIESKLLVDGKEYAAHGGAFPVVVKRVGLVGTITVSGLPQAEDHRLVTEEIEKFLKG